jgi:hypothetical protein
MSNANGLARNYLAIWNETHVETRRALIAETWTDAATYADPMFEVAGHDGIEAMVSGFQQQFPDLTFRPLGEAEEHHVYIRFSWELVSEDGNVVAAGTDVGVIASGRLNAVAGFFDQAPVLEVA